MWTKMSAAGTIFAITFILFIGITLIVPSFPPAQLICEYVRIPQTVLSISGISIATLLNGVTNGFFWTIVAAIAYGVAQLTLHVGKKRPLPPMPVAPHLAAPPPENPRVDSRVNRIPPALTIPPLKASYKVRKEPARVVYRTEPLPFRVSREPIGAALNIEIIDGIGPICGWSLRNLGIETVSDLLRVGATVRGRHRIANDVGVSYSTVLRWVYRGDLLRVKGIGKKYSALLESAGVNTVVDLSRKNPQHLFQTLKAVNRVRNLVGRSPPSKTIEVWVHNAKNLEPILVE